MQSRVVEDCCALLLSSLHRLEKVVMVRFRVNAVMSLEVSSCFGCTRYTKIRQIKMEEQQPYAARCHKVNLCQ